MYFLLCSQHLPDVFSCDTMTSYGQQLSCFAYQASSLRLTAIFYVALFNPSSLFSTDQNLLFSSPELGLPMYACYFGYSLTSGKQKGIFFLHFTCNVSVNKTFAVFCWLTPFTIHYRPHIWFCSTYTYLFLILHLYMLYLALLILCLVHYRSLLQFIKVFEWQTFFITSLAWWHPLIFVHVSSCFIPFSMKDMKYM